MVTPLPNVTLGMAVACIEQAAQFIAENQSQHLEDEQLLERCALHLQRIYPINRLFAHQCAKQGLGWCRSKRVLPTVDVACTTSYIVYVNDPANSSRYAFTAAELATIGRTHAIGRHQADEHAHSHTAAAIEPLPRVN